MLQEVKYWYSTSCRVCSGSLVTRLHRYCTVDAAHIPSVSRFDLTGRDIALRRLTGGNSFLPIDNTVVGTDVFEMPINTICHGGIITVF